VKLWLTSASSIDNSSFDEVGHNVETMAPAGPSGTRGVMTNSFDANGNLIATVTPIGAGTGCNPVTTSTCLGASYLTYDAENRLLSVASTDGTPTIRSTYNADGSKATETDGTGTSTFHYDSAGRLIDTTNGTGAVTTWGYNALGQLSCQSYDNNAGNTCASPLAGSSTPPTGLVTFTYDDQGRASSLITWNAVTLTTAYDCSGGRAWVSTGTASVLSCDATHLSIPATPTDPNAITTTFTQNATGQLTNQATTTNAGSTNLLSFSFTYDELSRLKSSAPTVNAVTMATDLYGYDPTSRVISGPITGTTGNPNYAYSSTGAMTKATTHFTSAGYAPNGQLCWTSFATVTAPSCASPPPASSLPPTSAPTTFTYDQNGNRTSSTSPSTSSSLTWQATSGRLICINTSGTTCSTSSPSATTTLYSYDGEGHRMSSSNNGTTNTFTWDTAASQLLADSTHDYLYLSGSASPDLQINLATGTVDLLIQDHNANTRGVVQVTGATSSLNGKLVNYTDYDAYGNPITESGGAINPGGMANGGVTTDTSTSFAFGAGYSDSSNLTYLVHRYLDNETGQFISIDPLVNQTQEAYVYAGDGPVMVSDVLGESPNIGKPPACDRFRNSPYVNCKKTSRVYTPKGAEASVLRVCQYVSPGNCFSQVRSNDGKRFIDVLDRRRQILYEVKTGAQYNSQALLRQSNFDSVQVLNGSFSSNTSTFSITRAIWIFLPNTSGISWPSIPLVSSLSSRGINVTIRYVARRASSNDPWYSFGDDLSMKRIAGEESSSPSILEDLWAGAEVYAEMEFAELAL